ncbi:MAG: Rha family transcriptional regulator, partial [Vibrio sp.]
IQPLASYGVLGNTFPVAAKSAAGIDLLKTNQGADIHALNDRPKLGTRLNRGFFMRVSAHLKNYGGLDGSTSVRRVLGCGKVNPVQLTTLSLTSECGDLKHHTKEAIMPNSISLNLIGSSLRVENDHVYVTSNELAKAFGKSHRHVVEAIKALDCSEEFSLPNFRQSFYRADNGQSYTNYHITRDGFAFLAMGFTGKKAAQFKEAYIQAFNQMEKQLLGRPALPAPHPIDTIDFSHQRWLVVVDEGEVTARRVLNTDEYLFNRQQFINYFKEPGVGLNQIDQLMELSKAVNERLVKLVQMGAK